MTKELITFLGDDRIGVLRSDGNGRLSFIYDESWRSNRDAIPLSLSMPLGAANHAHPTVAAYLWGLLPDNEQILEEWAKSFQVSARNPFALLKHVGEDCVGAVRFVIPERADRVALAHEGDVDWLDESQVGERLRALQRDVAAWRNPNDTGHFSLGGAQPKTALLFDGKRWGVPSGRIATTHILKPDVPGLRDHAQNEHFCLVLAGALGLPVADSTIQRFDGEIAIVVTRYDRIRGEGAHVTRIHQEDICQSLGVRPTRKYENDGGPGAKSIAALLREHSGASNADIETFVRSLALSWLIAGTDAHAKNYSVLIGARARVRLAPLYDVASVLPYEHFEPRKIKLAMKIGGTYRLHYVGSYEWQKLAAEVGVGRDRVTAIVGTMANALPEHASTVRAQLEAEGLDPAVLARVADRIAARARECAKVFD